MLRLYPAKNSLCVPIHESHNLGTGTISVGVKIVTAGAGGDTLEHGPRHSVGVVCVSGYVAEATARDYGRPVGTPQECDGLAAGQRCIRAEGGSRRAGGNALLGGPQHCVIV